ncbi:TPA: antiterminator Q family protein [Serratia fonticola]|uniref:antiterminator Q family protein n=1 Tax=Serratia fonticola TaxID=47917 RepID=UPI000463A590|nr:antiterminator Q family protein [Serratia fonticola]
MRDIQLVLERWGVWARDNTNVDYSHIAAGFKGLFPPSSTSKPSCCDDDGIIIDAAITRLKVMRRPDELQLLILHYVYGMSKRSIGRMRKTSEGRIRQEIMLAESFVDGCLAIAGVVLEMDPYTQRTQIYEPPKKVLVRYAKSALV